MTPLRIATRGSALAMAQAGHCADAISAATGRDVELVEVTTHGDISRESLQVIGGTGVFASAVREAVLDGSCDAAVHSAKDLPTVPCAGLQIAAAPLREDPRDALISAGKVPFADLPKSAKVGTGSPRRAAQLLALRPDLAIVDIRGNVDTRLAFVSDGQLDAVVLAMAGLTRLGRTEHITEVFSLEEMIPAAGQGVLAIECRSEDTATAELLRSIHHEESAACLTAERTLLAQLELGCSAPIGAYAQIKTNTGAAVLQLHACMATSQVGTLVKHSKSGSPDLAENIGHDVAAMFPTDSLPVCVPSTQLTPAGDS